ncbi:Fic family protein [Variovorax sp. J31P179]|nr:Fic family protein [Variovorax sp. J31P179]MDM0084073.1 Fic family protein [Variovorax sp. J31P179]
MPRKTRYVWEHADWPHLHFDLVTAGPTLLRARQAQGQVKGMAQAIGLPDMGQVAQELWTGEAIATAAIEGENLELASVRSSVLRHLGQGDAGPSNRRVEGLVDVMQDATDGFAEALDAERLCRWQSALFPGGTAGIRRIAVGRYRDHDDPMQIVSGLPGREVVHYTAPPSSRVPNEMAAFLAWFEASRPGAASEIDGIARAAIAHLWFETIHPFEDGNGRIGRAIADMALAQDLGEAARLYSLSRQLLADRADYYEALATAQAGSVDVTAFVAWFADAFREACGRSIAVMQATLEKSRFWALHAQQTFNDRQRQLIKRLLDAGDGGFLGGLNVDKYLKMTATSKATATRDLSDLLQRGLLHATGQGKALRYYLSVPGWTHGRDGAG